MALDITLVGDESPEILQLRSMTGGAEGQTAAQLQAIIDQTTVDGTPSLDRAAVVVWTNKAASYAALVDVSEAGSSRSMSQLHRNALAMAATYDKRGASTPEAVAAATPARARTRSIERA